MTKYVIKRVLLAFVTAFIIISLTFIVFTMIPPAKPSGMLSDQLNYYREQVDKGFFYVFYEEMPEYGDFAFRYMDSTGTTNYFYVKPALEQYAAWITNVVTKWDWGTSSSVRVNAAAIDLIAEKLPNTVKINAVALVISVPLGIALGVLAALKKGTFTDKAITVGIIAIVSLPSFVLISLLLLIFQNVLPTSWPSENADIGTRIAGYVIPVLASSLGSIAGYGRFVRGELVEVMSSDYLLLARTKGLTKTQSVTRHAMRNAMVPVLPSILAEFISVLGGSAILEGMYNIPGIGNLFITAINALDYNLLMVDMAVFTTISLLASVVLDLSYGFLDPRIRMGAKK